MIPAFPAGRGRFPEIGRFADGRSVVLRLILPEQVGEVRLHYIVADDGPVAFAVPCLAPWAFFGLRYSGQRVSSQCAVAVNYVHDGFFLCGERLGGSAFDGGCDGFSPVAVEVEVYFGQHGAVAPGFPRSVVKGSSVDAQHPAVREVEEGLRFDMHEGLSLADAAVDEFVRGGFWVVDHSVILGDVFRPGFPGSACSIADRLWSNVLHLLDQCGSSRVTEYFCFSVIGLMLFVYISIHVLVIGVTSINRSLISPFFGNLI